MSQMAQKVLFYFLNYFVVQFETMNVTVTIIIVCLISNSRYTVVWYMVGVYIFCYHLVGILRNFFRNDWLGWLLLQNTSNIVLHG